MCAFSSGQLSMLQLKCFLEQMGRSGYRGTLLPQTFMLPSLLLASHWKVTPTLPPCLQSQPASDPFLTYARVTDSLRALFALLSSPNALPEFQAIQVRGLVTLFPSLS